MSVLPLLFYGNSHITWTRNTEFRGIVVPDEMRNLLDSESDWIIMVLSLILPNCQKLFQTRIFTTINIIRKACSIFVNFSKIYKQNSDEFIENHDITKSKIESVYCSWFLEFKEIVTSKFFILIKLNGLCV